MLGLTGENLSVLSAVFIGAILVAGVLVGYIWAQRNDLLRARIRRAGARTTRERLRALGYDE